jgi:hypothetical protein
MTIVAVYKFDNKAVIINDFRVTYSLQGSRIQLDSMNKFKEIDGRMMLFLAGSVEHWKIAIKAIEDIIKEIKIDNIFDGESPLTEALRTYLLNSTYNPQGGNQIGAIGVLLDVSSGRNELFKIHGIVGKGCIVSPIPNQTCVAIGSGAAIPDVETRLQNTIRNFINRNQNVNLNDIGTVMRTKLFDIFKRCGASSFQKLGVSPIFALSLIADASFRMNGDEIKGEYYASTSEPSREYHYSFTREKGIPTLFDHLTGQSVRIKDINQFSISSTENIFDPENLIKGFDATIIPPENGKYYKINQWITTIDDSIFEVHRAVYETTSFKYKGQVLCNPSWTKITDKIQFGLNHKEVSRYSNPGDHSIQLKVGVQEIFQLEVTNNLFNHNWWDNHVMNYKELYS